MTNAVPSTRDEAEAFDGADPLAHARDHFALPCGITYLVGHSLGAATHTGLKAAAQAAQEGWAEGLVRSWNTEGWIDLPAAVGGRIASLIGAAPTDVVVCDTVSVNLFKLASAALRFSSARALAVEEDEFPTDQYIAEGLGRTSYVPMQRVPAGNGMAALERGGVLIKSVVNYRTSTAVDMTEWEATAQSAGAVIVWDLSHAVGVLPVDLSASGARFAVGCTYKYLNGGPGAPAFVFVRQDVAATSDTPLPGWLGHESPFAFAAAYTPAQGAQRFIAGTPPILSLAALSGALTAFDGLTLDKVAEKARSLGDLVISRARELGLAIGCPVESASRGGHVSLHHENGYPIVRALADRGILADFRTPDTIRFGLSPLFLKYTEVWDTMDTLEDIIERRLWDKPDYRQRAKVT